MVKLIDVSNDTVVWISSKSRIRCPKILWYEYTHFICPLTSWWTFRLLYFLAVFNNTARKHLVQVFVWVYVFSSLEYVYLGVKLLGHRVTLKFFRNCQAVNFFPGTVKVATAFCIPNDSALEFQFLYIFINTCYYLTFWL